MHVSNPSTWEGKSEGWLEVWGLTVVYNEEQASQVYTTKPHLKKTDNNPRKLLTSGTNTGYNLILSVREKCEDMPLL